MKKVLLVVALSQALLLQGCVLNAFNEKPDDPKYAPALPEEDYANVVPTGGIYNPYTLNNGMYSDTSAHKVGDIISVVLEESTSAKKSAGTSLDKSGSNNYGGISLAGKNLHYKNKQQKKYKPYVVITVFQRLWLGVLFLIPFIGGSLKVKAVVVIFLFLFGQIWSQTGNTVAIS